MHRDHPERLNLIQRKQTAVKAARGGGGASSRAQSTKRVRADDEAADFGDPDEYSEEADGIHDSSHVEEYLNFGAPAAGGGSRFRADRGALTAGSLSPEFRSLDPSFHAGGGVRATPSLRLTAAARTPFDAAAALLSGISTGSGTRKVSSIKAFGVLSEDAEILTSLSGYRSSAAKLSAGTGAGAGAAAAGASEGARYGVEVAAGAGAPVAADAGARTSAGNGTGAGTGFFSVGAASSARLDTSLLRIRANPDEACSTVVSSDGFPGGQFIGVPAALFENMASKLASGDDEMRAVADSAKKEAYGFHSVPTPLPGSGLLRITAPCGRSYAVTIDTQTVSSPGVIPPTPLVDANLSTSAGSAAGAQGSVSSAHSHLNGEASGLADAPHLARQRSAGQTLSSPSTAYSRSAAAVLMVKPGTLGGGSASGKPAVPRAPPSQHSASGGLHEGRALLPPPPIMLPVHDVCPRGGGVCTCAEELTPLLTAHAPPLASAFPVLTTEDA